MFTPAQLLEQQQNEGSNIQKNRPSYCLCTTDDFIHTASGGYHCCCCGCAGCAINSAFENKIRHFRQRCRSIPVVGTFPVVVAKQATLENRKGGSVTGGKKDSACPVTKRISSRNKVTGETARTELSHYNRKMRHHINNNYNIQFETPQRLEKILREFETSPMECALASIEYHQSLRPKCTLV